jgi:ribonuclease VapC
MVVDTSALVAILQEEPDASMYVSAILNDPTRLISAATFAELSIVMLYKLKSDPLSAVDTLVARLRLTVVTVDREQALLARDGYRRFGKGSHSAGLNLGDCFSYALSKRLNEPLLFKGNDFSQTDVLRA